MPSICDEFLPVIRGAFREAAERIVDGQIRGSRGLGKLPLAGGWVELGLAYGPHRDQSGDSTIFVSVVGSVIRDLKLKQALADEFGYIRARHTTGRTQNKTEFYLTLTPNRIAEIAREDA